MASSKSEFHVPGAYHFDNPPWPISALGANVYLPPTSPSVSNSGLNLDKSTTSLYSDISIMNGVEISTPVNTKRKRPADDSRESTPAEWQNMSAETTGGLALPSEKEQLYDRLYKCKTEGPIQYTLAGQIETLGTSASGALEGSTYSDIEYRRALGPTRFHETNEETDRSGTDANPESPALEHWTILHALGSVVGRVWDFCRGSGFRGFHAGGGVGYDWDTGKPVEQGATHAFGNDASHTDLQPATRGTETDASRQNRAPSALPLPDWRFHTGKDMQKTEETQDLKARHTVKRRQVGVAGEELGRNWVVVETDRAQDKERRAAGTSPYWRTATPDARMPAERMSGTKAHTPDAALRRISTPVSRLGTPVQPTKIWSGRIPHTGSPRMSPRDSFTSPRCSLPATPGLDRSAFGQPTSRIPVPSSGGRMTNPFARTASPAPGLRARSRNGTAPTSPTLSVGRPSGAQKLRRRGHSMTAVASVSRKGLGHESWEGAIDASPRLDEEARQLATRRAVAELDADAKMEAFNLRLQAMIRQGKEALGTAFEIDGDGEQEDWMDDD